jgi:hypothetical protein
VRDVADAVDNVVCPVTPSVPPTVSLPVMVEVPIVDELAVRYVVTKFVVVAEMKDALVPMRVVKNAFVEKRLVAVNPVDDPVASVVCPVTFSCPEVNPVADAVVRYACPETVSADDDAFPSVEVPEVIVENTPAVKVGLSVVAIVDVEVKTMLFPGMK